MTDSEILELLTVEIELNASTSLRLAGVLGEKSFYLSDQLLVGLRPVLSPVALHDRQQRDQGRPVARDAAH